MKDRFKHVAESIARHGFLPAVLRSLYGMTRRFLTYEICRIESAAGQPYIWDEVADYETRPVDSAEFHNNLCAELKGLDLRWAFERGDQCVASLLKGEVVGYNLSSSKQTRVLDGLDFYFPDGFVYSYGSKTAPSHRGRKLERDRWKIGRENRRRLTGFDPLPIWYVNVFNLESRAANRSSPTQTEFWGYAGYIRLFGKCYCFVSPRCRKRGAGFIRWG